MNLGIELNSMAEMVNKELKKNLQFGKRSTLYDAMRYLIFAGGKRLRPIIAMHACAAVGGKKEKALPLALALELVHSFTLIHDDIMDRDKFRRNIKTTHIVFGEATAINAGDALFARAFETLVELETAPKLKNELTAEFSKTIRKIAEGQQMDIEFEKRDIVTEKEYLEMIEKKTSALIEMAAKGGALVGNGTKKEIASLANYGKYLGLGFQIWDDFLGIAGDPKKTGKPVGNDLRRGKKTLIVVCGLNKAKGAYRKFLCSVLGNEDASEKEIRNAVQILDKINSTGYARDKAISYAQRAKYNLKYLQKSESREVLEMLADYSVGRDK